MCVGVVEVCVSGERVLRVPRPLVRERVVDPHNIPAPHQLTLRHGRLVWRGLLVHLDDARVVFHPHLAVLAEMLGSRAAALAHAGGHARKLVDLGVCFLVVGGG